MFYQFNNMQFKFKIINFLRNTGAFFSLGVMGGGKRELGVA